MRPRRRRLSKSRRNVNSSKTLRASNRLSSTSTKLATTLFRWLNRSPRTTDRRACWTASSRRSERRTSYRSVFFITSCINRNNGIDKYTHKRYVYTLNTNNRLHLFTCSATHPIRPESPPADCTARAARCDSPPDSWAHRVSSSAADGQSACAPSVAPPTTAAPSASS